MERHKEIQGFQRPVLDGKGETSGSSLLQEISGFVWLVSLLIVFLACSDSLLRQEYYKPKVSVTLDGWPLEFDWLDGQTFDAGGCLLRALHLALPNARPHPGPPVPCTVREAGDCQRAQARSMRHMILARFHWEGGGQDDAKDLEETGWLGTQSILRKDADLVIGSLQA